MNHDHIMQKCSKQTILLAAWLTGLCPSGFAMNGGSNAETRNLLDIPGMPEILWKHLRLDSVEQAKFACTSKEARDIVNALKKKENVKQLVSLYDQSNGEEKLSSLQKHQLSARLKDCGICIDDLQEESLLKELSAKLLEAVQGGDLKTVVQLLILGADTEAVDSYENTALMTAAWWGHKPVVEVLLDHGANIKVVNMYKDSTLLLAAWKGHTPVVEVLLDRGAHIEAVTKRGNTALLLAALRGHRAVVQALIDAGAKIDAQNKRGNTALRIAVQKGHLEIVELLQAAAAKQAVTG